MDTNGANCPSSDIRNDHYLRRCDGLHRLDCGAHSNRLVIPRPDGLGVHFQRHRQYAKLERWIDDHIRLARSSDWRGVARVGEVLAVEGEWAVVEWNKEWTDGADVCRVSDLIAVRAATPAEIEAAGYPAHATHAAMSSQAELAMKDGGR